MRDSLEAAIGIFAAFIIYTILSRLSLPISMLFNVFSIVVIYFAINKGEIFGSCYGAVCGLVQDSFSLGVFGVAGLAKTVMGFMAGYIPKKMNVTPLGRKFVFVLFLVSTELIFWALIFTFVFSEKVNTEKGLFFIQPLCTALLAVLFFRLIQKLQK